jgi:hypothetical protein
MSRASEYEAWKGYRRFVLYLGTPVWVLWLAAGLVRGVLWWTLVGCAALAVWLPNVFAIYRNVPARPEPDTE